MTVAIKWSDVFRLALAAAACLAVTHSVAVAQLSEWLPETGSYFTDEYRPLRSGEASILSVANRGSTCGNQYGCDGNCQCNKCCQPSWSCVAGTEITFLVPEIDDGRLDAEIFDTATIGTANTTDLGMDLHDMNFAPRVWLGVQRGCWGFVGRFWYLDTCDSAYDPFEADGFGYYADSSLEMQTIDLEVTRQMCVRGNEVTGSFGLRYASFDRAASLNTIGQSDVDDAIYTTHSMFRQFNRGVGVTSALYGESPICGTCVSWFYNARGSMLFRTSTDTFAESIATVGAGAGQGSAVTGAAANLDEPWMIAELQVGLTAKRRLECYPADAFVRVAFEFQHWSGDESESRATSVVGLGAPLAPTSAAVADAFTAGLDTNLFGLSIGTGLSY